MPVCLYCYVAWHWTCWKEVDFASGMQTLLDMKWTPVNSENWRKASTATTAYEAVLDPFLKMKNCTLQLKLWLLFWENEDFGSANQILTVKNPYARKKFCLEIPPNYGSPTMDRWFPPGTPVSSTRKTDFIIISPPWYDPGCCWGVKPQ